MAEVTIRQVGAASRALSGEPLLCTSLKSNMGHLEAAAAAAGLASLVAGPLLLGIVAVNAQLRRWVCDDLIQKSERVSLAG